MVRSTGDQPTLVAPSRPSQKAGPDHRSGGPPGPTGSVDPKMLGTFETLKNAFSDLFLSAGWILGMDFTT